jgi:hypothetical protein
MSTTNDGITESGQAVNPHCECDYQYAHDTCGKLAKTVTIPKAAVKAFGMASYYDLCPEHVEWLMDCIEGISIKKMAVSERARIKSLPFEGDAPKRAPCKVLVGTVPSFQSVREPRQEPLSKSAARKVWKERETITKASPEYQRGIEAAQAEIERRKSDPAYQRGVRAGQFMVGTIPKETTIERVDRLIEASKNVFEPSADIGKGIIYIGDKPDARPMGKRTAEPTAATICGFRFEYRAEGGSGFYWNGRRVASTREGLERMGPAVLAKVCR